MINIEQYKRELATNYSRTMLKTMIVVWAIFVVFLTVFVINNEWILAGMLLYEVLL